MDLNTKAFSITEATVVNTGAAGAAASADITAPSDSNTALVITWVCVSISAAPAAAVAFTIKEDTGSANTTRFQAQIPASATAPIMLNFVRPIRIASGKDAKCAIAAVGGAAVATVTVGYFKAKHTG